MIAIICRSAYLASSMSEMLSVEQTVWHEPGGTHPDPEHWLFTILAKNRVSVVFYEPLFFVDPAPFRSMSPLTRFVVLAGPGEENVGNDALSYGAAAMIVKPIEKNAVNGVFKLVSV